jgi:hypothetical protein
MIPITRLIPRHHRRFMIPILLAGFLAPHSATAQVAGLQWITGCWERRTSVSLVTEHGHVHAAADARRSNRTRGDSTTEYDSRISLSGPQVVYG